MVNPNKTIESVWGKDALFFFFLHCIYITAFGFRAGVDFFLFVVVVALYVMSVLKYLLIKSCLKVAAIAL